MTLVYCVTCVNYTYNSHRSSSSCKNRGITLPKKWRCVTSHRHYTVEAFTSDVHILHCLVTQLIIFIFSAGGQNTQSCYFTVLLYLGKLLCLKQQLLGMMPLVFKFGAGTYLLTHSAFFHPRRGMVLSWGACEQQPKKFPILSSGFYFQVMLEELKRGKGHDVIESCFGARKLWNPLLTYSKKCVHQLPEALPSLKSYDVDMLGFSVFLHASPIDYSTAVHTVWPQSMIQWRTVMTITSFSVFLEVSRKWEETTTHKSLWLQNSTENN